MRFVSTILFSTLVIISANANHLPTADFGEGCLNVQDDGSRAQVPDFETHDSFLVSPESRFRFSSDGRHDNQAVRVEPTVKIVSDDNAWSIDAFSTTYQHDEHEAWYKSNNHGKFAASPTWSSESVCQCRCTPYFSDCDL